MSALATDFNDLAATKGLRVVREQIASAVDLIVHQKRFPCGSRKVAHISEITGMESGTIQLQDIFAFQTRASAGPDGKVVGEFRATGWYRCGPIRRIWGVLPLLARRPKANCFSATPPWK